MKSSSSCSRRGLTLIEVVAALALMGALLVGIVMAKARHTRQLGRAKQQLVAVAVAESLLARWWQDPGSLPRSDGGPVEGHEALQWRTRVVANQAVEELNAQVIRLEIFDVQTAERTRPVVSIEIVLPVQDGPLEESAAP